MLSRNALSVEYKYKYRYTYIYIYIYIDVHNTVAILAQTDSSTLSRVNGVRLL